MTEPQKMAAAHLSDEQWAELDSIKQYHGLHNVSDVLRMLIRKEARRIETRATVEMTVPSEMPA